tara:strand:+ start:147 stop:308 length:162 start_codon:yes stop_codon:yes gene_type:complete
MHNDQNKETVSTSEIRFWSEGKITESAYKQIKQHQANKKKAYANAMLSEWMLD